MRSATFGPEALHLRLKVVSWTRDRLLAIFFFVAGKEVREERPICAGLAVPAFAFLSAGIILSPSTRGMVFSDRVVLGVLAGLAIGKFIGMFGGAWLSLRLGLAKLSSELSWRDMAAVSLLGRIGFTVSLLIGGLAYADDPARADAVTTGVLAPSLTASILAAILPHVRVRKRARTQDDV